MPHILNLLKVRPLEWKVTEWQAASSNIASLTLTGHHMHAQPAIIRFKNDIVAVAFFDGEGGKLQSLEQLHPKQGLLDVADETLIPEEVARVPVPHIHRGEINIDRVEELVDHKKSIGFFNKQFVAH
jgi:hypothetical protein